MLNAAVQEDINNAVLCWLATVDDEGQPNVSPKELFHAYDDRSLVVAEIASPTSTRNIGKNPRVCVSFIDVFRQRGFKIYGKAQMLLPDHPQFMAMGTRLLAMAGEHFKVRGIIHVETSRVQRIWAPSYTVFPDRTVEEQIKRAHKTYGVIADPELR
jgi:predicted pyridoxine 5'-phosphate oxidase superfamily flavin-nucleotide-binding protein